MAAAWMSRSKKKKKDTGRGKYLCPQLKHTSHVGDSYEHGILSGEMRRGQSTDKADKNGGRVCIFRSKKTDQTVFLLAISPSRLQECCTMYPAKPPKQYFSLLLRGGSLKGGGRVSRREGRHFSRMATKKKRKRRHTTLLRHTLSAAARRSYKPRQGWGKWR